jgi:hypothetical protein
MEATTMLSKKMAYLRDKILFNAGLMHSWEMVSQGEYAALQQYLEKIDSEKLMECIYDYYRELSEVAYSNERLRL